MITSVPLDFGTFTIKAIYDGDNEHDPASATRTVTAAYKWVIGVIFANKFHFCTCLVFQKHLDDGIDGHWMIVKIFTCMLLHQMNIVS